MTKEEFINKWCFNLNREGMDYDLDEVIKSNMYIPPITLSSQSVISWTPTVDPDMEGLGHQWIFPPADVFETAYCVCANCGVTSEEMESEELCKNYLVVGGEND